MNTIIEKIRAEVLRLIRESDGPVSQYGFGKMSACNRILNFLDTLQEQPVKDFPTTDEEMKQFLATHPKVELPEKYKTPDWMFDGLTPEEKMNHPLYLEGFEVGRKVGLVLAEKTTIPADGLEEEIKRYYDDWDGDCRYTQVARHFAQWGAEHLKK